MSADGLLEKIGKKGDRLWTGKLHEVDRDTGMYIPLREPTPPAWSLLYRIGLQDESGIRTFAFFPLLFPIDALHFVARIFLFPLVWLLWWTEKRVALWLGRYYFCPVCHNLMDEPLVYCPNRSCKRVQARLRPSFNSLFVRTCPACGEGRWRILGQRFLSPPEPLVCRHTEKTSGCYHPQPVPLLAGKCRSVYIGLAGTTVRAKHSVMAHLFRHLAGQGIRKVSYQPAWDLSELELKLCDQVLHRAFREDTRRCEVPGEQYTLGLTLPLQAEGKKHLLVFHNIAQHWLGKTEILARTGLNWNLLRTLVFVIDAAQMDALTTETAAPQVETYTRLVRAVEEYCGLRPGSTLPFRVAVVLALPGKPAAARRRGASGEMPPEKVERLLAERDPALYALLRRTVPPGRLRFFGGSIPPDLEVARTRWLQDVLEWAV